MHHNLKTTGKCKPARSGLTGRRPKRVSKPSKRFQFPSPIVGIPAAASLTLPNIAGIPPKLVNQKPAKSTVNIALALIDLGVACNDDAPLAGTPAAFIDKVFTRWIKEKSTEIQLFSPRFIMSDNLDALGEYNGNRSEQVIAGVSFCQRPLTYSLKEKIERLEAVVPGLGQTALNHLYGWLCRTSLAITPDFVHTLVQYQYWYGGDDEKSYYEEMDAMEEEYEEDDCPVTLAQFEGDFPKMAYQPSAKIKTKKLKTLKSHSDPFVAEIASLLLSQPDRKKWDGENRPSYMSDLGSGNECVEYTFVLDWESGGSEITTQVVDDWINEVYNSGISTELFAAFLADQTTSGVAKLLDSLENYFKVLAWLERAITALGTKEDA